MCIHAGMTCLTVPKSVDSCRRGIFQPPRSGAAREDFRVFWGIPEKYALSGRWAAAFRIRPAGFQGGTAGFLASEAAASSKFPCIFRAVSAEHASETHAFLRKL